MNNIIENIKKIDTVKTDDEKIELLNIIKRQLHELSPMKNEPIDCVEWIKADKVIGNDYNPNSVAPPEMELLKVSIDHDGYTQPIVGYKDNENYVIVDGFHRSRVGKEDLEINKKIKGYLPITTIKNSQVDKDNRMASTIRHNRARGKHQISKMSDIILNLKRRRWSDEKIATELGMSADEVLRLSQITGLAEMFKDREFSKAWEMK
jgi:ParB-like chromosome segregation protein Spo0J